MCPLYIYGLHDPGGEYLMAEAQRPGWIVFTEAIGADPNDRSGRDYRPWSEQGFGVLVRLNNGYRPGGTIPRPEHYTEFAQRCANFVAASAGCERWIIGNEPNLDVEWPEGQIIRPEQYANCFLQARARIKQQTPAAEVILAAIAPWTIEAGDWLDYFAAVCAAAAGQCEGFALHTYSHGADPSLVTSEVTMNPPYQSRHFHFRAYQDFLERVPPAMRSLPVYITETDEVEAWEQRNTGWVQEAYAEVDRWNQMEGTQKIACLCLYRWPQVPGDRWGIEGNHGVIEDLRAAMARGYLVPKVELLGDGDDILPREWDVRLDRRGITLREAATQPGKARWRVVKGQYLDEQQSQGRHHVFVDVLDAQGQRKVGVRVEFAWRDGRETKPTEAKPGEAHALDFPMYAAGNSYDVKVVDGDSDQVLGLGLGSVEQPFAGIHVSYRFAFQETTGGDGPHQDTEAWRRTIAWVLEHEGGFQNNPADPGNWTGGSVGVGELKGTKYGISAASYPHLDIINLTSDQAESIYFTDYWRKSGADTMAWPVCLLVMDTAVLHGVGAARQWLGEVGPDPYGFAARRLRVYTGSDNWSLFGAGWVNRVADLLEKMR